MKITKIKHSLNLPKVVQSLEQKSIDDFPLDHYSYSTFVKFSTNPIMFKINYVNGDRIDSTRNISGVMGNSFHRALEVYYADVKNGESEAIKKGLEAGSEFLDEYNDGYIEFSKTVANKQKAFENFSFAFNSYVQETKIDKDEEIIGIEECIEENISVEWRGELINLPVKLKGYIDKIVRKKGKLKIIDYKTTRAFSDPEKIDGSKIIQAIQYYFLAYAKYKEEPYSMIFEEVKMTKNRDGSDQVRRYEIVYKDNEQFFDFYFRFYDDMTRSINGESVFPPNIYTFFDNEVGIIAYIHRLDIPEHKAELMKKLKVKNITELLQHKIEHAGNMRKLMQTAEKKFISAKSLNYENMQIEERISAKLLEFGTIVKFHSKIEGNTVNQYRFTPRIGVKMSKLKSFTSDIEQVVGVSGVRILAPIPNSSFVGFEVPREERIFPEALPKADGFNLSIGVDIMGENKRFDIRNAPHMLVAGATGSGKSVFLNSVLSQLCTLENVELHLFDPKMVELARFAKEKNTVEHYSDPEDIYLALDDIVKEMNSRYKKLAKSGSRNIEEYKGEMTYKFVVIDEFGDLIVSNHVIEERVKTGEFFVKGLKAGLAKTKIEKINLSNEIMKFILVLAQKARACGIHIIIATQRPSVDIITGSIKANFPTKVAFRTAKEIDSKVVIDQVGAEKLLGKGDMLFSNDEGICRLQGFNA